MLIFAENRQRNAGLSFTTSPRTSLASVGLVEETTAEAEAGTATGRYMSARRVKEAIDAQSNLLITTSVAATLISATSMSSANAAYVSVYARRAKALALSLTDDQIVLKAAVFN